MIRKALAMFAVAIAVLFFVPASPANALQHSGWACTNNNGVTYNITVCADYGWRMQNDSTGVHLENVRVWVGLGCNDLENTALSSVIVSLQNGGGRVIGNQGGCDVTWDLEDNGPDVGAVTVQTTANVNVNNSGDYDVNLTCEIHPSTGNSDCSGSHN